MFRRALSAVLLSLVVSVAGSAQPAVAQRAEWEIVPNVLLQFNPRSWRINSAENRLENTQAPGCTLSLNVGRGIPPDWKQRTVRISRGTRRLVRTTFYDEQWRWQFSVYRYLRPTNLGYLNSEGVLLTPPDDVRRWGNYCRGAAEFVLATARRVGN